MAVVSHPFGWKRVKIRIALTLLGIGEIGLAMKSDLRLQTQRLLKGHLRIVAELGSVLEFKVCWAHDAHALDALIGMAYCH